MLNSNRFKVISLLGVVGISAAAHAQPVQLRVTIQNLAPANSLSFAPLRVGFHNGTFDSFNEGTTPTAPIISIAEGGSGNAWFPAFAAAEPNATLGTVVGMPAGPLLPGATAHGRPTGPALALRTTPASRRGPDRLNRLPTSARRR